jgi:hypothetical protein
VREKIRIPIVGLAKLRSAAGCTGYYPLALSIGWQLQEGVITLPRVRLGFQIYVLSTSNSFLSIWERSSHPLALKMMVS